MFVDNSILKPPANCPNGGSIVFTDTPATIGTDLGVFNFNGVVWDLYEYSSNFEARTWLAAVDATDASQLKFVPIAQHDWILVIDRKIGVTDPTKKILPNSSGAVIPPVNNPVINNGPFNTTTKGNTGGFSGPDIQL